VTLATIAPPLSPQPQFRQPQQSNRFFPQQQRFQQGKRRIPQFIHSISINKFAEIKPHNVNAFNGFHSVQLLCGCNNFAELRAEYANYFGGLLTNAIAFLFLLFSIQ
jgi:hypothetical protein